MKTKLIECRRDQIAMDTFINWIRICLAIGIVLGWMTKAHGAEPADIEIKVWIQAESSGRDWVVGDGGKSWGCLQIGAAALADANKVLGTKYTLHDLTNGVTARPVSMKVDRAFVAKYATIQRLGRETTEEDRYRIHHRGLWGCFDNGAVDCRGTLIKDPVLRAKLARRQWEAKRDWEKIIKPALDRERQLTKK